MATIKQIREGIETRLGTVSGLRTSHVVKPEISPPEAMVMAPTIDPYHGTMGKANALTEYQFEVWVFTSAAWLRTGQDLLDEYASPTGAKSVKLAIEGDQTLGGVVDDCFVSRFRSMNVEEIGAIGYIGGIFTVPVFARGT